MAEISTQAFELNSVLEDNNPALFYLLSLKGKRIFFPAEGILKQSAEAKDSDLNASIGVAFNEDGSISSLSSVKDRVDLNVNEVVKYSPSYGIQPLREMWKSQIEEKNPDLESNFSLPVVMSGLTHALAAAAYLFVDSGDQVILPNKFWGNYKLIFQLGYEAEFEYFEMFQDNQFNVAGLKEKLLSDGKKKIVILNFPNNPSGYTPTVNMAAEIINAFKEALNCGKEIAVILDEAYFGLFYDEAVYRQSLFAELTKLDPNLVAIKVDGSTKEDFAWGLRVGYFTVGYKGMSDKACKAIESKAAGFVRSSISSPSNLSQNLLLRAMQSEDYDIEKKATSNVLRSRYREVKKILKTNTEYEKYFQPLPFNSGYFMCIKLEKDLKGETIRHKLLDDYSTGVIAIDNLIRIAYSSVPKDQLPDLFHNIYKACRDIDGS